MNHEKHEGHEKVLFKEESFALQGAIYDVYREMGSGFLEWPVRGATTKCTKYKKISNMKDSKFRAFRVFRG
jgi:hypothetical protein